MDAVVVDKQGEAVPGFDKGDFVVTEDGKPQTVTSFEAVTLTTSRRVTDLGSRPSWSTNQARVRLGRTFFLLSNNRHGPISRPVFNGETRAFTGASTPEAIDLSTVNV